MIRDLSLADALLVCSDMRPADAACVRAMTGQEPGDWFAAERWGSSGPAWALEQDGQPWAIGGVNLPQRWHGVMWLIARPGLTGQSWRKLIRETRKVLACLGDPAHPAYVHRVEALVLGGWPEAQRFAEALGFEFEGVRRALGARGEDVQIWARVGPVRG